MKLANTLLLQLKDPTLSHDAHALLRCKLAKELEGAGNYEAAREVLKGFWHRIGEHPKFDEGLGELARACVLLRAGNLTGWIGSAHQIENAQELAKDLITESITIFESLGDTESLAEAKSDLAFCYWRQGAFDEARDMLHASIVSLAGQGESEIMANALIRSALVENSAGKHHQALRILTDAHPLFTTITNNAIKGKFHNTLANALNYLSTYEPSEEYIDRALVEYAAASFHFEQAGHTRSQARVENNMGLLLVTTGRLDGAHQHL